MWGNAAWFLGGVLVGAYAVHRYIKWVFRFIKKRDPLAHAYLLRGAQMANATNEASKKQR